MRAVVQRVARARVEVSGQTIAEIARGLCVFVGVGRADREADVRALAEKVIRLRVFEDELGKMNRSLADIDGSLLAVSQFTLYGDARRGRRPSFIEAMEPEQASTYFEKFCEVCQAAGVRVELGQFRAHMLVELANDGPVTVLLDTAKLF